MEQYCFERFFAHVLIARKDHPDNPEENNVIARDQHIRGIEIFQVLGLLRPAQCLKRPQGRRKPGVQGIGILGKMRAAAFGADFRTGLFHHGLPAGVTVVSGNPVSPP